MKEICKEDLYTSLGWFLVESLKFSFRIYKGWMMRMAVNKKKVVKKEKEEPKIIVCAMCDKEKGTGSYYASHSPFHTATNRVPYCKECILPMVNAHNEHSVRRILMILDKPFLNDLYYDTSKKEAEKGNRDWFATYLKNLAMNKTKELTWEDSDRTSEQKGKNKSTDEFWGEGYTPSEIEFLEDHYREYEFSFATDNPVQINIYKNIAVANLQARKALQAGKQKDYKDLIKLSSELHKDAHINPSQITGANDDKGVSTYGLWIKMVEETEPCEYFEDKPAYEDFDGFGKYINKWFVRPMKNLFGLSRDFNVDMEDEETNDQVEEMLEDDERDDK